MWTHPHAAARDGRGDVCHLDWRGQHLCLPDAAEPDHGTTTEGRNVIIAGDFAADFRDADARGPAQPEAVEPVAQPVFAESIRKSIEKDVATALQRVGKRQ